MLPQSYSTNPPIDYTNWSLKDLFGKYINMKINEERLHPNDQNELERVSKGIMNISLPTKWKYSKKLVNPQRKLFIKSFLEIK